ncbi:MAG: chromosome segregation protein [Candidatus Magnetoglobus multicellularis str. Araruama]|uniref:Chromosome partition protein Smc n=1 Tax=Candidatus Magnetoglobus multicellularis str. Araruama TaxID=890399 RepID=A0A1V1P5X9_9BACT|nr:MAG: chromosome segregation protein [Candidatus Magnetoglobus multicellularis str. Araruama]
MKLKQLEISGFKSFCDKTKIQFPAGVSAIVGPNGCGKSNILDALRWVMGEQSSRQLRGKSMDDVIFAGTDTRAPSNKAEVSLTLINDNKQCPDEYKDHKNIVITRSLNRKGESGYFINRTPARLKDIQNLLMGSGMGSRTYAIVQQNNVGAITEAGPDERRVFIEEAAGIMRYKFQKKEALKKLESTNQNLLRVKDIVDEVAKQMKSVQRQAEKAERFGKLQERIFYLDVSAAIIRKETINKNIEKTNNLLESLRNQGLEQENRLQELNDAIENIQRERLIKDNAIAEQRARQFDLQRRIDKMENDRLHGQKDLERLGQEIQDMEDNQKDQKQRNLEISTEMARVNDEKERLAEESDDIKKRIQEEESLSQEMRDELDKLNSRIETSKAALMDLLAQEARFKNAQKNAEQNKASLDERFQKARAEEIQAKRRVTELTNKSKAAKETLEQLKERNAEIEMTIEDLRDKLDQKRHQLSQQIKKVQNMDISRSKVKSRYQTLKKMDENHEWFKGGIKAIMARQQVDDRILSLVVDVIEPFRYYEEALEVALGEALQFVIVKDAETGIDAMTYLKDNNAGRSGFLPGTCEKETVRTTWPKQLKLSVKPLMDCLSVKKGFEEAIEGLLGNVLVAKDIHDGITAWKAYPDCRVVTQSGESISEKGILIGGSKTEGIIAKKQEVKQLEAQLKEIEDELINAKLAQQNLENELKEIESDLQRQSHTLNTQRNNEIESEKQLYRLEEDLKHAQRNLDFLSDECKRLSGEETMINEEISKSDQALNDVTRDIEETQKTISKTSTELTRHTEQLEDYQQKVMDLKLESTNVQAKLESQVSTLRRLQTFENEGQEREKRLAEDISEKTRQISTLKKQIDEYDEYLKVRQTEIKQLEESLSESQAEFEHIAKRMEENNASMSKIKGAQAQIQQKTQALELEQSQRKLKLENIDARIKERFDQELDDIQKEFTPEREMPLTEIDKELSGNRKKLNQIGAVNMDAIEEYKELEQRFEFLSREQDDLNTAVSDLNKVIRKINKICRERFVVTFNQINEKLGEVFPQLFQGGSAKLVMTEPEKPLETGVEFMVHPPGKRLTRLTLLSGGEKALSAIAFIFSIFLIRPAAFCVMDEIDAPLDEANVGRFNRLLKIIGQQSQIIMVTHNKGSMEFADILFGVTMEQKGVSKLVSVNLSDDRLN